MQGVAALLERHASLVDRRWAGPEHHLITDGHGTPLAPSSSPATATASLSSCLCSTPSHQSGARRDDLAVSPSPSSLTAATTTTSTATPVRARRIRPVIARRGTAHGSGLGVYRWVVERTLRLAPRLQTTSRPLADIHWFGRTAATASTSSSTRPPSASIWRSPTVGVGYDWLMLHRRLAHDYETLPIRSGAVIADQPPDSWMNQWTKTTSKACFSSSCACCAHRLMD